VGGGELSQNKGNIYMEKKNYQQTLSEVKKEHSDWKPEEWKVEALKRLDDARKAESKDNAPKENTIPEIKETLKETSKTEVKKEKTKDDEMIVLSKKDIMDLISAKGNSNTDELLKQLISTAKSANVPEALRSRITAIKENEIDMDDYMPDAKTFFSYRAYYAIYGDKKFGRETETPYGTPIRFIFRSAKKMHDDSKFAQSTLCLCVATIHSKKEYDYLKNHSQYGWEFHEEIAGVANIDVTLANKYGEVNSMVSSWSQHQVLKRAEVEGIEITTNIEDIKNKLIHKLANQELARIKEQREKAAKVYHSSQAVETDPENFLKKQKQFA